MHATEQTLVCVACPLYFILCFWLFTEVVPLVCDVMRVAIAVVRSLRVRNAGWSLEPLSPSAAAPEVLVIRGYDLKKSGQTVLNFPVPGTYVIDDRV